MKLNIPCQIFLRRISQPARHHFAQATAGGSEMRKIAAAKKEAAKWQDYCFKLAPRRRVRDLNPRDLFRPNGFQDRRIQPLCQLSALLLIY